ncbi:asparagine synthetase B [Rubrivirga sp. SAORIC476]|uniref:asparagine synthetase B n=1 Tax=Rubrivirga sp. SAORIC476 TaxID=1961794 RepID=UPI000BA91AAB|nr:asparagine synthetase B [Rubrivirga sp. SAORIC476]PAP82430.1 asparagine synthetase B [Rubrivirga sp. SAORIC476]
MRAYVLLFVALLALPAAAQDLLIPMDDAQADHLRAYGAVYVALDRGLDVDWLLNVRGGSFVVPAEADLQTELRARGVSFERVNGTQAVADAESPAANTSVVRLEKAPTIAVYAPDQTLPWDDAVLLALTYAEVPYETIYDADVLAGRLGEFDWVHLHHEDFSGQYGKFFSAYGATAWYQQQQQEAEASARAFGFAKVSQLKLAVAQAIRQYVVEGGFLFAMCSGADTFDLALAAAGLDIVPAEIDGDGQTPGVRGMLDYSGTLAFQDFHPELNVMEYEHADIDDPPPPALRNPLTDYFTLFEFSARWDPVPTMLTQNHVASVRGFMGQTTAFQPEMIKPGVVVLAKSPTTDAVRYLYGPAGQGFFAFYGGHDPEDYQHYVGDPPTDLSLHRNSPGYRLILNNVLFPAAKKQPQKT